MLGSQQGTSPLVATVKNWYNSLPLCTKAVFSLITGIFLFQLITGRDNVYDVCLSSRMVVFNYQAYRLLSSVLVHGGLLHVTFNMLAFVPMANSLERLVGTLQFTYLLLLFTVLTGVFYVLASYALAASRALPGAPEQCAIGFSGVIFGLVVVDVAQSGAAQHSIFGLFSVPARLYPWALLLFWQLLMPSVSFVGHLAGVMVGQLWVWGYLRPLALPRSLTAWMEESRLLAPCIRLPSFIMMPGAVLPYTTYDTSGRVGGGGAGGSGGGSAGGGGGRSGGFGARLMSLGKLLKSSGGAGGGGGGGTGDAGGVDGGAGGVEGRAGDAGAEAGGGAGRAPFHGTGRTLGGGSPAAAAPGTAAALAAEARVSGGAATGVRASAAAAGAGAASKPART